MLACRTAPRASRSAAPPHDESEVVADVTEKGTMASSTWA